MRKNLPISDAEHLLGEGDVLVSQTDPASYILEANDAFCEAAGYPRAELVGQTHNIVRHPSTPPAIFGEMWDTIRSGRIWNGIVKNRRKDGGFYWVEANVSPVFNQERTITGYVSVRTKPSREQVREGDKIYAKIGTERRYRKGLVTRVRNSLLLQQIAFVVVPAAALIAFVDGFDLIPNWAAQLLMLVWFVGFMIAFTAKMNKQLGAVRATASALQASGDLTAKAPVMRSDEIGQLLASRLLS